MTEKLSDDFDIQQQDADRVRDNLKRIQDTIASACAACGRLPEEITLLGVTKTVSPALINVAIENGITHIGENRVQEFLSKRDQLHIEGVDVHIIGHLQTNKVDKIIDKVDMIESIDTLHLAQAVASASLKCGRITDVLVEVNIGGEAAKSGVSPDQTEELLRNLSQIDGIHVRGLMTVPPISDTNQQKRDYFMRMRKLFIDIRAKNIDNTSMDILSMGMSSDYTEAILEGATMVRIGSALFGKRV